MSNKIKVAGYSQKISFGGGIEYRPFSPDLVGNQLTSDGGTPLFTMGNFSITTNMDPKIDKDFTTSEFSKFVSLSNLDLTLEENKNLLSNNVEVLLNLDKSNLKYYALFGSLTEFIRVSLENIITYWPASLYLTSTSTSPTGQPLVGNTYQDYNYDSLTQIATFKVDTTFIINKFQINYLDNGNILNSYNAVNPLRDLNVNYKSYVIYFNNNEYAINGFTGSTTQSNDYIYLSVNGNPFSGLPVNNNVSYHIKPSNLFENKFFNSLPDFEYYLLNRQVIPKYTANFKYPIKTDNGIILYITDKYTWPVSDGYNIDFDTTQYVSYATKLLDLANNNDLYTSNLMNRFLVAESISDFDTVPVNLSSVDQDTSGQKINKTLQIYGVGFDKINNFISGIAFANTVSYDKADNTPDVYLKNLAKVLGWDLISTVLSDNLLDNYITPASSSYSGLTVGLTPIEADTELWRRIILNTPWIWKSKGARKSIEFLLKFIGTPIGLIQFNEYVYKAEGPIDIELFKETLLLNGLDTDLSIYPIDSDGFPNQLPDTQDMYFQNNGLWYRETGGSGATIDILSGNNPHLGPYDKGYKYINQFNSLIPNFTPVTISSQTLTESTSILFTNYNLGKITNYTGSIYVDSTFDDGTSLSGCYVLTPTIIQDPTATDKITNCGCELAENDDSLSICVAKSCTLQQPIKIILNPNGNAGSLFLVENDDNCNLQIDLNFLINIKCETLSNILNGITVSSSTNNVCNSPIGLLETLDLSLSLELVTGSTLQTLVNYPLFPAIGEGNLYEYLKQNTNSGFYVCGDSVDGCIPLTLNINNLPEVNTSSCDSVMNNIIEGLFIESGLSGITNANTTFINTIKSDALISDWLKFSTTITDPTILDLIKNNYIKLSVKVNNTCGDFCILLDEIVLDKICTHVERNDIFITQSPSFNLQRIQDNKKSWINNSTKTNRTFSLLNNTTNNLIRQTNYNINDERLIINTKEIDLDINLAKAIETNVWSYINDNPCILTGIECGTKIFMNGDCFTFMDGEFYDFMNVDNNGDDSINYNDLFNISSSISGLTTIEGFENFMTSELIDAKNRQTLSAYPTLRALYDRYMNSLKYCSTNSGKFDYLKMDEFAKLVGNYWVDIVEQVVPATSIWGSVKKYSNTIFDQQKYKYKAYTSLFEGNIYSGQTVPSPINNINGQCTGVSITMSSISRQIGDDLLIKNPVITYSNSICLSQMNIGSEFIGRVVVAGPNKDACVFDENFIGENPLNGTQIIVTGNDAIVNVVGGVGTLTFLWSDGQTTQSVTGLSSGSYSVIVNDSNCNSIEVFCEV